MKRGKVKMTRKPKVKIVRRKKKRESTRGIELTKINPETGEEEYSKIFQKESEAMTYAEREHGRRILWMENSREFTTSGALSKTVKYNVTTIL